MDSFRVIIMHRSIPVLGLLFSVVLSLQAAPPRGVWKMTFDEEFSGNMIDTNKWNVDNSALASVTPGDQGLLSTRLPDNLVIHNGICHFVVKKQETVKGFPWSTAGIKTRAFHQEYGYFEARIRYGSASGLNNAFWLDAFTPHPVHYEIDINEGHYPNLINMTVHNWTDGHTSHGSKLVAHDQLMDAFHIYGLLWTPSQLAWFMDGKIIHIEPATDVRGQMRVLFSTAVLPWAGKADSDLAGTSMDVDWVRVYQQR